MTRSGSRASEIEQALDLLRVTDDFTLYRWWGLLEMYVADRFFVAFLSGRNSSGHYSA